MKWFNENRFALMMATVLILLVTTLGMTAQGRNNTTLPEGLVSGGFGSVSQFFYSTSHYVSNFSKYISELGTLRKRNQELEAQVNEYKNQMTDYERMQNENQSLKSLLDFKDEHAQFQTITATVTSIDPDIGFDLFVLNRGAQDGVSYNMSVVVREGLVGRVVEVSEFTCKVLAVTDKNSMFNGVNVRTGAYVRMTGEENYQLKGYMDMEADVQPGDILVTSGLTGGFEADLVIGEVVEVTTPRGKLEQEVTVSPAVDMQRIRHVLILK